MIFSQEPKEHWSQLNKLTFRFLFVYFVLYIFLIVSSYFLEVPFRWFAENILYWGSDFDMKSTGSGDRTFDYVKLGFNLVLALISVIIWSILDRKRLSYNELFYWFQVILRVSLFLAMFLYGFAKLFKSQFPYPSLERLLQPVGDMSPMGLAWTFMGHSFLYNFFIGFAEVMGGILLLMRKTTTIGSMLIVGVMTNVAMMNFTYDIPVKLFSFHLVLMALILLLADGDRVIGLFFRNVTVKKVDHRVPFKNTTVKNVISSGKMLIVIVVACTMIFQIVTKTNFANPLKTKSVFYGIWESSLFVKNNDTLPPLLSDPYRWRYLIIEFKKKAAVKKMDDSIDRYKFEENPEQHKVIFRRQGDTIPHHFSYRFIDSSHLLLNGTFDGDSLRIQFRKKPKTDFQLVNRKFHWVNEFPYNR